MKFIDPILRGAGRFVFGLGVGLALTSAVVIVSNGPALEAGDVKPADPIRLDPIVVTISPQRFDEQRAALDVPPPRFHPYGSGALKV